MVISSRNPTVHLFSVRFAISAWIVVSNKNAWKLCKFVSKIIVHFARLAVRDVHSAILSLYGRFCGKTLVGLQDSARAAWPLCASWVRWMNRTRDWFWSSFLPPNCVDYLYNLGLFSVMKSLVYADKPETLDDLEANISYDIVDIRPQIKKKK